MKTTKMLLLVLAIAFSSVLSASTTPTIDAEPKTMEEEIGNLLKNPKFVIEQDVIALVTITINKDDEIVVLSVDSESQSLKSFIKGRLNYIKVSKGIKTHHGTYVVPVRLTPNA